MEPEGSLPQSQVPANCPYPEPARSSPCPHILLPEDPSLYYPPIYAWLSQLVSFSQTSPPKLFIRLSFPPYALHAPPISFFLICHPNNIAWGVQSITLLIMYFSPLSCYLVPLRPKCSLQHSILKHLEPTFLPQCKRPSFTPIQNMPISTVKNQVLYNWKLLLKIIPSSNYFVIRHTWW